MIGIQRGDISEVLRDFFNIGGKASVHLDEALFGVAQLADLGQAPHRREARGFAQRVSHIGVAAESSAAGIVLGSTGTGGARIRKVLFENSTAAAHSFTLVYSVRAESLTGFTLAGGFCDVERPGEAGTSLRLTPLRGFTADEAVIPGVNFEQRIALVPLPISSPFLLPLDVMLYPGCGLAVYCNTVNTAVGASFYGDYYPEATNSR